MCLSVCLSFCLTLRYSFNFFLPPLTEVRYPNFLQIPNPWRNFTIKGCKMSVQKKLVFGKILPYWAGFFWYQYFSLCLTIFWPPLPKFQCLTKLLDFRNHWGKLLERSGIWKLLLNKGVKKWLLRTPKWSKVRLSGTPEWSIITIPKRIKFQFQRFLKFTNMWVPFNCLFAPTSQNLFFFEILNPWGKSNEKKWPKIWKLLLLKGVQLLRKKKLVSGQILPY